MGSEDWEVMGQESGVSGHGSRVMGPRSEVKSHGS